MTHNSGFAYTRPIRKIVANGVPIEISSTMYISEDATGITIGDEYLEIESIEQDTMYVKTPQNP